MKKPDITVDELVTIARAYSTEEMLKRISFSDADWSWLRHQVVQQQDIADNRIITGIEIRKHHWLPDGIIALEYPSGRIQLARLYEHEV